LIIEAHDKQADEFIDMLIKEASEIKEQFKALV